MQEHLYAYNRDMVVANLFTAIYKWMAAGLFITALVAYYLANYLALEKLMPLMIISAVAQIVIVLILSFALRKISAQIAFILFFLYSTLTGITFSSFFMIYTSVSIVTTFMVCSLAFLSLGFYGSQTKHDLTPLGRAAFFALLAIFFFSLLAIFFPSLRMGGYYTFFNLAGIAIFSILIAWDHQKIKNMAFSMLDTNPNDESKEKLVIFLALQLYLDFINLFIYLINFTGKRRD